MHSPVEDGGFARHRTRRALLAQFIAELDGEFLKSIDWDEMKVEE